MKNRIYAISLLLSFLVVLSHEMIPHHHEDLALNFSVSCKHDEVHEHNHHHKEGHQHNHNPKKEEKSKKHNHSFPFHQHVSATNDLYIIRPNLLESNTQIRNILFLGCFEICRLEVLKPPNFEVDYNKEPPFLISSIFNLVAFSLRGPPAIF
jgi:hypothetical protein